MAEGDRPHNWCRYHCSRSEGHRHSVKVATVYGGQVDIGNDFGIESKTAVGSTGGGKNARKRHEPPPPIFSMDPIIAGRMTDLGGSPAAVADAAVDPGCTLVRTFVRGAPLTPAKLEIWGF